MESSHIFAPALPLPGKRVVLVGNPNVGKSILFHRLTGKYAVVSNYPGTTVEISQGQLRSNPDLPIIDTPGIIAFPAHSEDEAVTARVLLQNNLQTVIQVGDAKNIRRTLHLTVQLAEMGLPLILVLNMMDEAHSRGQSYDTAKISHQLQVPLVSTVATRGLGMDELLQNIPTVSAARLRLNYPATIETALAQLEPLLPEAAIARRALGILFLSNDPVSEAYLQEHLPAEQYEQIQSLRSSLQNPAKLIQQTREAYIEQIAVGAMREEHPGRVPLAIRLGHLASHPLWGLPILVLVLLGIYYFVGVFGAGTLVGLLENDLFGKIINPWISTQMYHYLPTFFADLIAGPYGLWTMGITYAVALLLPIVTTFFIAFGVLEDSGYLPRLSILTNRFFTRLGLNGQAVLPMVLGLGCVTMATMTTRILKTPRERILVTLLLALAVPCSAQLGVVLGMLSSMSLSAALIWSGVLLLILMLVGWLAAKLIPGERSPLIVELPPLRLPVFSNVLLKTAARLEWYVKEAVPLFLIGTLLLFTLDKLNVLPWLTEMAKPVVTGWLGMPPETASIFLLGFLRRDFAATGLFQMQLNGLLTPIQVVVSIVVITLFIPCIASLFMLIKERGLKSAMAMAAFIFPFALLVGGLLQRLLLWVGWNG